MTSDEIRNRFTFHPVKDQEQAEKYETIRNFGLLFAELVAEICPQSKEATVAINSIDQAVMWANAAIARHSEEKERPVPPEAP